MIVYITIYNSNYIYSKYNMNIYNIYNIYTYMSIKCNI